MAKRKTNPDGKSLVIVESPAKSRTINKYLGPGFEVKASMGHIRDLPAKEFGVDLEKGFEPTYAIMQGKSKVVAGLKAAAGLQRYLPGDRLTGRASCRRHRALLVCPTRFP
jgi:DNA topoisomerase-1